MVYNIKIWPHGHILCNVCMYRYVHEYVIQCICVYLMYTAYVYSHVCVLYIDTLYISIDVYFVVICYCCVVKQMTLLIMI